MCLIDQENIVILCLKGEETLEAGSRIKGIIVIADDRITPGTRCSIIGYIDTFDQAKQVILV